MKTIGLMNLDRYLGIATALFGVVVIALIIPNQVEQIESSGMEPKAFPTMLSWGLVFFGVMQALFAKGDDTTVDKHIVIRVLILCAVLALFIYASTYLRFIYLSPLLAIILMKVMGENRLFWLVLGAVGTPLLIWLLVDVLLGRQLI